jgi:hypothetical protein
VTQQREGSNDSGEPVSPGEILLQGGDQEHLALTLPPARPLLASISIALDLIAHPLSQIRLRASEPLAPNELAAVACLGSAFRGLRASTLLALSGYSTEARTILRRTYEAAALARMLAHEPALAEQWLRKGQWFPDGKVREWFGVQAAPGEERTGYQEHYRYSSAFAHPTVRSTFPLLIADGDSIFPALHTLPDPTDALMALREVMAEAVFVCFAVRNAMVDPVLLSPPWHQMLSDLTQAVGLDLPEVQRHWQETDMSFDKLMESVVPAEKLDDLLRTDPNSYDNVRMRASGASEQSDESG